MAGAYMAKPDAVVTPDIPDGWNVNWPFPGPLSPGYIPDYNINFVADATYIPGTSTGSVAATFVDHSTFATTQPQGSITWSATKNGIAVPIKESTDILFSETVSTSASQVGDFWIGGPALNFSVVLADAGDTIILSSSSPGPDGEVITQTADILIVGGVVKIITTTTPSFTAVGATSGASANVQITDAEHPGNGMLLQHDEGTGTTATVPPSTVGNYVSEFINGDTGKVTLEEAVSEQVYTLYFYSESIGQDGASSSCSMTVNTKLYINDVLENERNDLLSTSGSGELYDDFQEMTITITTHTNGTYEIVEV